MKSSVKVLFVFLLLSIGVSAFAQENEAEKTTIRITPRIWYSFVSLNAEDLATTEQFTLPLYGATLSVTPRPIPNWNFLLTGLYGEGDGEAVDLLDPSDVGRTDVERTDIELLGRYNFPGRNLSIFFGPRYVKFDTTLNLTDYKSQIENKIYLFELGLGTHADLTEDGRHRIFGSFTFGLGWIDWEYFLDFPSFQTSGDFDTKTYDFNFGYQYAIGASTSVSLRYRLFAITTESQVAPDKTQTKLDTIQGPELAFTVAF